MHFLYVDIRGFSGFVWPVDSIYRNSVYAIIRNPDSEYGCTKAAMQIPSIGFSKSIHSKFAISKRLCHLQILAPVIYVYSFRLSPSPNIHFKTTQILFPWKPANFPGKMVGTWYFLSEVVPFLGVIPPLDLVMLPPTAPKWATWENLEMIDFRLVKTRNLAPKSKTWIKKWQNSPKTESLPT